LFFKGEHLVMREKPTVDKRSLGLCLVLLLGPAVQGRGGEEDSGLGDAHRRNSADAPKRLPMHSLLSQALDAAQRGDKKTLAEAEKSLSPMNEAIFRVFGVEVQGAILRASEQGKTDTAVLSVMAQILLSIRLLMKECRGLTDAQPIFSRLGQALLNYRVIEKPLSEMYPTKAQEIKDAFDKLQACVTKNDLKTAMVLTKELEVILTSSKVEKK
jgi:hypothetical protein